MKKRKLVVTVLPEYIKKRVNRFCRENKKTRTYVIIKSLELFLDVFESHKRRLKKAKGKIMVLGQAVDDKHFPKDGKNGQS